jgi:hypothetical protein
MVVVTENLPLDQAFRFLQGGFAKLLKPRFSFSNAFFKHIL